MVLVTINNFNLNIFGNFMKDIITYEQSYSTLSHNKSWQQWKQKFTRTLNKRVFPNELTNRFNKNTIVNFNQATAVCFPSYQ